MGQLQSRGFPYSLPSEELSHLWLIHWTPNIWGSSEEAGSSFSFTTGHDSWVPANSQASPHPIFHIVSPKAPRALQSSVHALCRERNVRGHRMSGPHLPFSQGSAIKPPFPWCGLSFTAVSHPLRPSSNASSTKSCTTVEEPPCCLQELAKPLYHTFRRLTIVWKVLPSDCSLRAWHCPSNLMAPLVQGWVLPSCVPYRVKHDESIKCSSSTEKKTCLIATNHILS